MKTVYNKEELKEVISKIVKIPLKDFTWEDKEILYTLEHIQTEKVLSNIKEKQNNLKNLYKPHEFLNFYIPKDKTPKDILYGCQSCLSNKITHIRHSSKCNVKCPFCYYIGATIPDIPKYGYRIGNFYDSSIPKDQLFMIFEKQLVGKVNAIGWLGREPLLELDKIKQVGPFLRGKGIHQYLYTNGTLANIDTLKALADAGLNELRFNLQATDFDDRVIENMIKAVDIIENVGVETPIYSKSFSNFIKHKTKIVNSGIKQINMPELQVSPYTIENFAKSEGEMYRHRKGYTSPISSRKYVYRLIELAIEENWPVIINDCSNETKLYRDTPFMEDKFIFSQITYKTQFSFLPTTHYFYIIDNYIDSDVEIF